MAKSAKDQARWFVYILRCADETFYTGITTDLATRVALHNRGSASKYTRGRVPVELVASSSAVTRTEALRLEAEVKSLPREKKLRAILGPGEE